MFLRIEQLCHDCIFKPNCKRYDKLNDFDKLLQRSSVSSSTGDSWALTTYAPDYKDILPIPVTCNLFRGA